MVNIVPYACELIQRTYAGLSSLAGNILILAKPIKILIVLQSILLGVMIDDAIIIMVIPRIITIFLHLLWHGQHQGDVLGCQQQYGCR